MPLPDLGQLHQVKDPTGLVFSLPTSETVQHRVVDQVPFDRDAIQHQRVLRIRRQVHRRLALIDGLPIESNRAGRRGDVTTEDRKQRRFAGTVWPDYPEQTALVDGQIEPLKGLDLPVVLHEISDVDSGCTHMSRLVNKETPKTNRTTA